MRIGITTVSYSGYGFPSKLRWNAFNAALDKARNENVALLCLPGGYFGVRSDAQFAAIQNNILRQASEKGLAVSVGIDEAWHNASRKNEKNRSSDQLVREQKLPSFATAWTPASKGISIWRQRSSTSQNQWFAPENVCRQPQTIVVAGRRIEILTCGEIFNERIRDSILSRCPPLHAIVDLSHIAAGFRADHALKRLARDGFSFCCTHAEVRGAVKRAFAPGGRKISSRDIDIEIPGPPRIEIKLWTV